MAEINTTSLNSHPDFEYQNNTAVSTEFYSNDDSFVEFTGQLHEFLDFYQLFDTFINELKSTVPYDSIEYQDESTKTSVINGRRRKHHCEYTLKYEGLSLGTIRITREIIFLDNELDIIEAMLAGLSLPLRNALRYKQAISFSQRDELTGLRNGSYCRDTIEQEIERAHRYKEHFSLLLLDLDEFENINTEFGRKAGDAVLHEVARRIESVARGSDVVYRNGGDEFMVFLPNTEIKQAMLVAQRVKDFVLANPCVFENNNICFTLSAGVVTVTHDDTALKLQNRADQAIFHAKVLGKDRIYADTVSADASESTLEK